MLQDKIINISSKQKRELQLLSHLLIKYKPCNNWLLTAVAEAHKTSLSISVRPRYFTLIIYFDSIILID
jgi:hypothetical protein